MTRDIHLPEQVAALPAAAAAPRLLLVPLGDARLAALAPVLAELGLPATLALTEADALALLAGGPLPDILLTACPACVAPANARFARICRKRWPGLALLYVTYLPRPPPPTLGPREQVLPAPFDEAQLRAALAGFGGAESLAA